MLREDIQARNKVAGANSNIAKSGKQAAAATKDLAGNFQINALRYQLYDVANTFRMVGRYAVGAGTAVFEAGIAWDRSFANVIRTSQVTGSNVAWLKEEFLELQTILPVSADSLAKIGTLGAQMGVAAGNLVNFTDTTARFSAAAELSVDESATAMARLNELLPDVNGNYERLASTILKTGVNAVATEHQIVLGTNQIASIGQIAGLSTPEVVGLASAMSSLGLRPELQRSVITASFSRILSATAEVTAQTEKFGAVLNMTGKEFQTAWREDAIGTYRDLLKAIASRGDAVSVLKDLGLASQRLTPNLLKLGQNTNVLNDALGDTRSEWQKNTELTRQYDIIAGTVSAKIDVLAQTWEALLVTLDTSDTVVGFLVDTLTNMLRVMREVAKNPFAAAMATIAGILTTLVGITVLGAAGLAALVAGYIAIQTSLAGLSAASSVNTASTVANTLAVAENAAARGVSGAALTAETIALMENSAAGDINAFTHTKGSRALLGFSSTALGALPAILKWAGIIGLAAGAVAALGTVIATAPDWTHDLSKGFAGVKTPEDVIKFDTDKIKAALKVQADLKKEIDAIDAATKRGRYREGDELLDQSAPAKYSRAKLDVEVATKDLQDEVEGLSTLEEKYAAVTQIAKAWGTTTQDILENKMPELGELLGDGAAAAADLQEETFKLEAATALWGYALQTTDMRLAALMDGVKSGATSFFDLGSSITDAYTKLDNNGKPIEVEKKLGGGMDAFISGLNARVSDFESFYGELGKLTQRGGTLLATEFAKLGPESMEALTDSLKLSDEQLAQIESQLSLAQFYSSEEFAKTFTQTNAILAQVWQQSGHDPKVLEAFNTALNDSMKGGSIDPKVLADLGEKFGIKLNVDMLPTVNEKDFTTAQALAAGSVVPITIPVETSIGQGDFTATRQVDQWIVEMEGHSIIMDVNPDTALGRSILTRWREAEYQIPVDLETNVRTVDAKSVLDAFINGYVSRSYYINFRATMPDLNGPGVSGTGRYGTIATGGVINKGQIVRNNYPKFARGTILRGPGSGTSDSILARVSNGEAITRARAVRYYGSRMMEDINNMRFPRYAKGHVPSGYNPGNSGGGTVVNSTVIQNYPQTRNPVKQLRADSERIIAGIWGGDD